MVLPVTLLAVTPLPTVTAPAALSAKVVCAMTEPPSWMSPEVVVRKFTPPCAETWPLTVMPLDAEVPSDLAMMEPWAE